MTSREEDKVCAAIWKEARGEADVEIIDQAAWPLSMA